MNELLMVIAAGAWLNLVASSASKTIRELGLNRAKHQARIVSILSLAIVILERY